MSVQEMMQTLDCVGSYDLVKKIAEGGMGSVHQGRHRLTGEIVAIKVMSQHMLSNQVYLKRFEQEYFAARGLNHPNIVRAIDFGRVDKTPYLVMEFVEGESLGQKIERDLRLSEAEALQVIVQSAQGLHKAHLHGLIHRDVKPDNILLSKDGKAKITDLGLVKERDADLNLTKTGRGLGTPNFMAPEQFRNAKRVDIRSDVYSLAATLYMSITGELPYNAAGPLETWMKKVNNEIVAPRKIVPSLSERVDWAIRRAMSSEPSHRPSSCLEFVEDLLGKRVHWLADTEFFPEDCQRWTILYQDAKGQKQKRVESTDSLRQAIQAGTLGNLDAVSVTSESGTSPETLRQFPQFRDLLGNRVIPPQETNPNVEVPKTEADLAPVPAATTSAEPTPHATPKKKHVVAEETSSSPHIDLGVQQRSLFLDFCKFAITVAVIGGIGWFAYNQFPIFLRRYWY